MSIPSVTAIARAWDLAGLPLKRLADLPTIVVDATPAGAISREPFRRLELAGHAILF